MKESDREDYTTSYSYDDFDRSIGVIYADGSTNFTSYDAMGRPISVTDATKRTT